jgi:hypothetical protein
MANNAYLTNAAILAMLNALATATDAGTAAVLEGRSGTQPADADTAVSGTLLFTCTLNATGFGAGAADINPGGRLTASAISDDTSADATATLGYMVLKTQTGGTVIGMFSVGTSGADFNFNTLAIVIGSAVSITAFTISMAEH